MTFIPNAGTVNWVTTLDLDFTVQSSQTLGSDAAFTVGGLSWTKMNSANDATAMAVTNGAGLVITPNSTSNISSSTMTAPLLRIPMTTIIPNFTMMTPFRIWAWVSASNEAANFDEATFGIFVPNAGFTNQITYNC